MDVVEGLSGSRTVGVWGRREAPAAGILQEATEQTEGGTANFTVSLSASSAQTVTVTASTANGTALAGTDYSDMPAPQILAGAVATELRARGYRVEDSGDVPLTIELTVFQHAFRAGFVSHGSEATVSFTASLVDGAGKRLFQGSFTGPFNGSAQMADGDNVRAAYEGALASAVRKLVDSPELQNALAAAAQPRA